MVSSESSKKKVKEIMRTSTITLTFGDAGENHNGMEMLGTLGEVGSGFSMDELRQMEERMSGEGFECTLHDLGLHHRSGFEPAGLLVVKQFADLPESEALFEELVSFEWDRKFWCRRRKRVLNKHARSNVMILDGRSQEPCYEEGKGRVVEGDTLPVFAGLKARMVENLNRASGSDKASGMICEGNRYFDLKKCGIGYHGDTERRKVVAVRVGAPLSLHYTWFHKHLPVGGTFEFTIENGDLYVMSEKAVGYDWKRSSIYTLRHAAGASKYTSLAKYAAAVKGRDHGGSSDAGEGVVGGKRKRLQRVMRDGGSDAGGSEGKRAKKETDDATPSR